jgi:hypothetical protein
MIIVRIGLLQEIEQDIQIYFNYSSNIFAGLVPYRDFVAEYPPGALAFFLLPRIFSGEDILLYRLFFVLEIMLVELWGWFLTDRFYRDKGCSEKHRNLAGLFYITVPTLIWFVSYQRFDFIPAVLVLWSVILYDRGKRVPAWALMGLGFAVKLYPVILAPVFLAYAFRHKTLTADFLKGVPAAVAAVSAIWIPFMAAAGNRFWVFLSYHGQRGIQLESIYSSVLITAHWFGYPAETNFSFGSWNLVSPVSPFLARISLGIMAALMILVFIRYLPLMKSPGRGVRGEEVFELPWLAILMVLAFVIGGKVLSPQYLLWILPLLVVVFREGSDHTRSFFMVFGLIAFLSLLIYPLSYRSMTELALFPSLLLLIRNGLLVLMFYFLLSIGKTSKAAKKTKDT